MKNLELVIEKYDGHLWGSVNINGSTFMATSQGESIELLQQNIKDSIEDYITHEGMEDKYWNKVKLDKIGFDVKYDLSAFFEQFNFFNLKVVADELDINRTLLNHYKSGTKKPSLSQAKRIEEGIHRIAEKLCKVELTGS